MTIKKALLFLLVSILLSSCASQRQVYNLKGKLSAKNYKIEAPLVAFDNNRFVVKVKIQGEDYNFMVSTGHHFGLIDKKLAQKLGYKIFRKDNMDLCIVPKLNIGTLDYSMTLMEIFDFSDKNCGCTRIDGYIGANLMSSSLWQMDYPNEKIIIASHLDSLQFTGNKQVVNFHQWDKDDAVPIVNLSVHQNYYCDINVATAACYSLELPANIFNPVADSLPQMIENNFVFKDKGEKPYVEKIVKIKGLTIGENIPIDKFWVIQSPRKELYLGNYILRHFVTTFDWKKQLITFSSPQIAHNKTYGFLVGNNENFHIVTSLTKDSPAEKMGLLLGDKIIKINDLDISKFTEQQLDDYSKEYNKRYWKNEKKGLFPNIKVTVQRGTEIKVFDIEAVDDDMLFIKKKK
jgi:hypothetical protein